MKKLMSFIGLFFVAPFIICCFNLMAFPLDIYIPINFVTICVVGLFKIFGLLLIVVLFFLLGEVIC